MQSTSKGEFNLTTVESAVESEFDLTIGGVHVIKM